MKQLSYKTIFLTLISSLLIVGCKTSKHLEDKTVNHLPQSFSSKTDSSNSASINWKQYFTDSKLIELIDLSLKNNLDMFIAMQRIESARASVGYNKSALFPTLNGDVTFNQRKFGYYTMDDAGNRTTEIEPGKMVPTELPDYYIGLQTSWEIDIWGKLRNKKKAAIARYFSSVEGKNIITTNLIADLANAYYELIALDNELEIITETIKLQQSAVELITIQKETGVTNELAVQQFQAQLFHSKALEYEITQKIALCESTINVLLGRYPQTISRSKLELNSDIPIKPMVGIPSNLLKNRPDIKQAEFDLIAAKAEVKSAKAAFYPSLNINGSIGLQAFKAGLLFTNPQSMAYSVLGNLMAPLLNRNAIKTEFKYANAIQLEALFNYQKTILNGFVEVYNQVVKINSLDQIVNFKSQESKTLTKSIETSSDLFKTGRATYIEVLMTQKSSLEAKLELIDAKKRQYNVIVDIYKALGGGWN
jgi:outer membrane protein, multidrug efflux system